MTITSARVILPSRTTANISDRTVPPLPPVYSVRDPSSQGTRVQNTDYEASRADPGSCAIVIDNGSHVVKAGLSTSRAPTLLLPPIAAKYRDRKNNVGCQYIGYAAYQDATTRGQIKNAFESGSSVVSNWDVMEGVLDNVFLGLGCDPDGKGIERPVVMTEPVANLGYSRKMMNELLFECYSAPSVSYGIDSLFSYRYNGGRSGLVVSSSHSSTHVIPVLEGRGQLSNATRLNWGGAQGIEYMMKLLKLKYPTFPGKMTDAHVEDIIRKHCYVAQDYEGELSRYLEWTGLEDRDAIIQYPYTEHIVVEKTEEELAKIAERKKESGRRLQEQAAKMRLDKLIKKEQELEYYKQLQTRMASETKKEIKRILDDEELRDEAHLERLIRDIERSVKRSRNRDLGVEEVEENPEEMTFPLLDIPDDQLDEASLKEKRHQRLMKSNIDARQRAKEEKERERHRLAEQQRLDDEKRENDFETWIAERRAQRDAVLARIKERNRLTSDLGNRKSLASQMRMKTLATLAADGPRKRRRGGGPDDDTFGANDEDWGVYRTVQIGEHGHGSDDEDDDGGGKDLDSTLQTLEATLLEHDPHFTENHTLAAQSDWKKSLVHMFLRGPWPFDAESTREANQLHLNVERIRVPEAVFDPSIAGLDQAGLVEIAGDMLNGRFAGAIETQAALLRDVFVTGGNSLFRGFDERFRREFVGVLPREFVGGMNVRRARDPVLDAWRGAAEWVGDVQGKGKGKGWEGVSVSRSEWEEMGGEYIKEHGLGNAS